MPGVAVAALGAILIGLLGAMLVYAVAQLLRPLISGFLGQLPGVGPWILARQADLLAGVWNAGRFAWDATIGPVTDFIRVLHWAFWNLADNYIRAIEASLSAIWRVKNWTIPWYFGKANEYTQQLHAQAIDYTNDRTGRAVAFAIDLYGRATAYATELYVRAVQYSQDQVQRANRYAESLTQSAIDYTTHSMAQAVSYAGSLFEQGSRYAQALQAQALGYAQDAFGRSIEFERRLYADSIGYAQRVGVQAEDYARALERQSIDYTQAAVGTVAAAVTALENSPCQRYCAPLGQLGQLLQQAEDIGLALLLLALAGEMARDARGTARTIDGLIGGEVRDLVSSLGAEAGGRR